MNLTKINEDIRGEIYSLTGLKQYPEIAILTIGKGYSRGGCIHPIHDEYACIIEGDVKYIIGNKEIALHTGEIICIPKNTPHYLIALTDSVVLEWGADPEEKKNKHLEFRKIVDEINKKKNDKTV